MPNLSETLDLLHRHHRRSGRLGNRTTMPTTAAFHSLWGHLREIRGASEEGKSECTQWLAEHSNLIAAVEACEKIRREDAARAWQRPGH